MRGLILSTAIAYLLCGTASHAKDLIYLFVDAKTPLEHRSVVSDFAGELLSRTDLGYDFDIYLHVDGIRIHYPDMPAYQASRRRDVTEFLAAISEVAQSEDYFAFWRTEAPDFVETTTPATALGVIAKNMIEIEKGQGAYDDKYFIQLSNMDFIEPVDTSKHVLGDGWITAPSGPLKEFVYGSQSRVFKDTKVFVALQQPQGMPLPWYQGRRTFFQKFYSSVGADIRAIKRVSAMPYGGGAVLAESFVNAITSDTQIVERAMPQSTNLVQIIDPKTDKAETVQ